MNAATTHLVATVNDLLRTTHVRSGVTVKALARESGYSAATVRKHFNMVAEQGGFRITKVYEGTGGQPNGKRCGYHTVKALAASRD